MKLLLLAPHYDARAAGESWSTYKWVEGMSQRCEATVLTQHSADWNAAASATDAKEVVNWSEPKLPGFTGRLAWELKPGYLFFYRRARRWLRREIAGGRRFDLIHQINPLALRYPCPARGLGIPYIIGPLAGSLSTPAGLRATTPEKQWYRKLRALDLWRLRYDPWLRGSYRGAAAIVGVAPYVESLLAPCPPPHFEIMSETGVESVTGVPRTGPENGAPLRLIFVGRLIRTKGVLEAIECVAALGSDARVTLDIIGTGDIAGECSALIARLKIGDKVRLHGRLPREEVFKWYDRSDLFLFPSYREPSGNVVFEAMSRGLPVVTSSVGGPGFVVTAQCGRLVEPTDRASFVRGLSAAVSELAADPGLLRTLSAGAIERMNSWATWPDKYRVMAALYERVVASAHSERHAP